MEIFNNQSIPFINADFTAKGREQEKANSSKIGAIGNMMHFIKSNENIFSAKEKY